MAKNSSDEIFAFWRDGSGTGAQYYILKWDASGNNWTQAGTFTMAAVDAQTPFDIANDDVSLAIDASGAYHVAFKGSETAPCCAQKRGIVYGYSANGSTWAFTALQVLSDPSGWQNVYDPTLRLDPNGRPHVVHQFSNSNDPRIYAVEHRWFNGSSWQMETIISHSGNANNEITDPHFDISLNGDLHVTCIRETGGTGLDGSLWYYKKPSSGGSWTGTELLHGSGNTAASVVNAIQILPSGFVSIINSNSDKVITEVTNASGSWQNLPIGAGLTGIFPRESYSVNGNGDKFFGYKADYTTNTFHFALKPNGSSWTTNGTIYADGNSNVARYNSSEINNSGKIIALFERLPAGGSCGSTNQREIWSAHTQIAAPTSITGHPSNATVCAGGNTSFSVTANGATGYQWQVNPGSGFTNITNGGVYSNATTATLSITAATAGMNGYLYRCIVQGSPNVTSNSAALTVLTPASPPTGISGNADICYNSPTTLTVSGGSTGSSGTIEWFAGSCGGTVIGTNASITVSPLVTTTYYVRYKNSCNTTTCISRTVNVNSEITASISKTDVSCFGGSNGTATVAPSGGTLPYTYSWSPGGGTGPTATGLSTGTYTCFITDNKGCVITRSITVDQPTQLTSGISKTDVSCFGGSNGTATVTPSGGTLPYTYSWSPSGGTGPTATGLSTGTYTCSITDNKGCAITRSITVDQPAQLTSGISKTDVSCFGGSNGTATVSPSGGTPGYTYSWSPSGGTNPTASGLAAGTYTCSITDANSCSITRSITIDQPTELTSGISKTDVSCFGGSNGTATVSPSGGTPGYTYSWSPSGGTNPTATGLSAGTYTCFITDANSCLITRSITVDQPTQLTSVISKTDVSCFGGSNGTATVTPSGGTLPYTYSWSPSGGTGQTASGLSAGIYTCFITDNKGCSVAPSITVGQPSALSSGISAQTDVTCNGGSDGSATVLVTGGTPGYTYSWSPSGGTGATASGLSAGTYTCFITDANSCTKTQSVTINEPAPQVITVNASPNPVCTGETLQLGVSAASTYSWTGPNGFSSGIQNPVITGITEANEGNYSVSVTDAIGCLTIGNIDVIVNPTPDATATPSTQTICSANAIATIVLSGAVPGTTFNWSRDNTASVTGIAANGSGDIYGSLTNTTNVPVTVTFTITPVVDGCTGASVTAVVTVNPTPDVTATPPTQTICSANAISAIMLSGAVSGTTFNWSRDNTASVTGIAANGSGDISGSLTNTTNAPVTVTFTITPVANGCTGASVTATITVNPTPDVTATPPTQTICSGNAISTIVLSGAVSGTTFSWSRNNTASVTGIAANGSGNISGSLTNTTNAPVTVTFTITPVANGCNGTPVMATVTVNPTPAVMATPSAQTICSESMITPIALTGPVAGTTFSWTRNNTATVTGIAASGSGNITGSLTNTTTAPVTVTFTITPSANGCTGPSVTATVVVNPKPVPVVSASPNPVCVGSNLYLSASGGASYTWSGPDGYSSNNQNPVRSITQPGQGGDYHVTVTSVHGCQSTATVNVTVNTLPVGTISVSPDPVCVGGTMQLNATGGVFYSWSGPQGFTSSVQNPSINNIAYNQRGVYTVTITNSEGCSIALSENVNILYPPTAKIGFDLTTACEGQDLQLFADGPGSAYWTGPNGFASTLTNPVIPDVTTVNSGIYTVVITSPNGCTASASVNITINALPVVSVSASAYEMCEGETVQLFASGSGMTYKWTGPSGYISYLQNPVIAGIPSYMSGVYTLEVKNSGGCTSYYSLELHVYPLNSGNAYAVPEEVCEGGILQLFASEGAAYLWLGPNGFISYDQNPVLYNVTEASAAGEYHLIIYGKGGCEETHLTVSIKVKPAIKVVALANPNPVTEKNTVQFSSSPGVSYLWSGPLGFTSNVQNPVLANVSRYHAGIYTVEVENENGCISTGRVNLKVLFTNKSDESLVSGNTGNMEGVSDPDEHRKIFVPEGVYPNPTNDVLFFEAEDGKIVRYSVYNTLGLLVMQGQTSSEESISTAKLPSGVYQVVYRTTDSSIWNISRFIKLN